jgi:type IV pilus assembly protein PilB
MYNVIPVDMTAESITLATSDLVTQAILEELRFVLTREVGFVLAREEDVRTCVNQYYGDTSESVNDMLSSLEEDFERATAGDGADLDEEGIEEAAGSTPVIRFVNLVLYQAIQDRASDIHFEPFENEFKIRYRVDGSLYEMTPPPKRLAGPVTSRIKVMANMNIAERRLPQDGRINLTVAGRMIDLRVSTLPTQSGLESCVLRVLDRSTVQLDLENLGIPEDVYHTFSVDIEKPNGIIIVTGPTGSGKTTTLYSALMRINTVERKLLTCEEPVEYDIEGIMQVPISEATGNTFPIVLRAFLRQDPDVMMVGEIRDLETAQIAIQASLTGHLVFSTLHTNDAAGSVTRLIDMGVEPYLASSTLEAIVGQRLLRVICDRCKTGYSPDITILEQLEITADEVGDREFQYGSGCAHCSNTGYRGRRGIYEYLSVTDPIRELINDRSPTLVIREKARELGMRTLREDGVRNILDGYTTVDEVMRYT